MNGGTNFNLISALHSDLKYAVGMKFNCIESQE